MLYRQRSVIVARMSYGLHLAHAHLVVVCSPRVGRRFAEAQTTALTGNFVQDVWPLDGSFAASLLLLRRHWRVVLLSVDV